MSKARSIQESLMEASVKGDKAALEHLISLGANLNEPDFDGATTLHWCAASEEGESIVEWLIKRGAELEVKDSRGFTPLHVHCAKGRYFAVSCLLHYHANVNAQTEFSSLTPLHIAVRKKHAEIARVPARLRRKSLLALRRA
jgi:ankyrin repeat protein